MNHARSLLVSLLPLLAAAIGCGSDDDAGDHGSGAADAGAASGGTAGSTANGGATGAGEETGGAPFILTDGGEGAQVGSSGADGGGCESASSEAVMKPAVLGFAFDVSGSMGEGDEPWHDKSLKWDPVVAATNAFFTDPSSSGITASVTFFPEKADDDVKCAASTYETPDVPLTALPSVAFGTAIAAVEKEPWGDGTPTIYVVRGVLRFLEAEMRRRPDATYALVLVTDGYPQDCTAGGENDIPTVAKEVAAAASTIPTYVIGVANPPIEGAPDTVSDLQEVAKQGGTSQAFLIDTGDPASTTHAFRSAVDAIRRTAASCTLDIPAPPTGKTFEKEKVVVTYESGAARTDLAYDASCSGANAWRYDDPAAPRQIVLCGSTCDAVQLDPAAKLSVAFTCNQQIDLR